MKNTITYSIGNLMVWFNMPTLSRQPYPHNWCTVASCVQMSLMSDSCNPPWSQLWFSHGGGGVGVGGNDRTSLFPLNDQYLVGQTITIRQIIGIILANVIMTSWRTCNYPNNTLYIPTYWRLSFLLMLIITLEWRHRYVCTC